MKKLLATAAVVCLVLVSGCGQSRQTPPRQVPADATTGAGATATGEAGAQTPQPVSYSQAVAPIFARYGCLDCHHPENAVQVDLTRPFHPGLGIINRPNTWTRSEKKLLVVPGDPGASALILKVERLDLEPKIDGDPMPWNIPPLTERERTLLRQWIQSGAANDGTFAAVARLFGDGVSLGSRGGKCSYCHWSGAAYGPDLTNVFDPDRGAVGVRAARGGIRVVPGDPDNSVLFLRSSGQPLPAGLQPPMPKHFDRLSEAEVEILRKWIAQGALDN